MSGAGGQYGYHPQVGGGGGMAGNHYSNSASMKPKVGLAVVCRCAAGNTYVQCLLQRRGMHSSSPNKWSFPGGRLEHPGDLEDDGSVGTRRELNEECGGGTPPGLPPLIHIECCKTGKQSQTLYHVYVVDTSHDKEWESWQPKSRNGKFTTEVDTVVASLLLQNKSFPCINGYSWVNMGILIQECYGMSPPDMGNSDLQHGLIRWVQNYGEHILKILIARSPKLHHSRRLSNPMPTPMPTPLFQNGHMGMVPRPPTRQDSGGKPRRFNNNVGRGGMLQPPYPHFPQHAFQVGNSPTNAFYNMGIIPNQSQLSPPTGTNALTTPSNAGMQGYQGVIMHVPPGMAHSGPPAGMGQGLMYVPPPVAMMQPPIEVLNHAVSTQPSSPTIMSQSSVGVAKSDSVGEGGVYLNPHSQSLISSFNPLMATSSVATVSVSGSQPLLNPGGPGGGAAVGGVNLSGQYEALPGVGGHHGTDMPSNSVFPIADSNSAPTNQFPPPSTHSSLGVNTPVPPHPPLHPAIANIPGHTPQGESEPLLPNPPHPPVPLLPLVHPIQTTPPQPTSSPGGGTSFPPQQDSSLSSRKEILCRHYMIQGNCPFGEKCWFAHPEPIMMGGRGGGGEGLPGQGAGISSSPLHVQVPPKFWPMMDYAASPPQSPMNPALMPRPPIVPAMFRPPRGGMAYSGHQPLLFLRNPLPGAPRGIPGSNLPLIQPSPIPMPLNPILKFGLLSQVVLQGHEGEPCPASDVTQLATYADHFFISYSSNINTYKIIFGGNKNYQESAVPTEKKKLEHEVSCLVCSQQQPMLLLVGTEEGNVSLLDMRKGAGHGTVTPVHSSENPSSSESISSLIHFSTSINSAQVVVTGSRAGVLAWHIAQPPQKTFSLLYLDNKVHTPNRIISLRMLGGFLASGDTSGKVAVWSMMSQTPSVHSMVDAHTLSLIDLHVVDANHFVTIGTDTPPTSDDASAGSSAPGPTKTQPSPPEPFSSIIPPPLPPSVLDILNMDMSQMSVQPVEDGTVLAASTTTSEGASQYYVKFWEYGKPPKVVKSVNNIGDVLSSSFHCHNPPGNMFLGLGLRNGMIKIYNVPNFTISSELYFPEMKGKDCMHVRLNLSREAPLITPAYYRNPFRDLILTSVWSDGKIMVCQVAKQ